MSLAGIELDHFAVGVGAIAGMVDITGGVMGGRRHLAGPGTGFIFAQWSYARGEIIEIIEPEGEPGGFMHRFLEAHGPGVHHITFKVDDIRAARARAEECGYEVVGYDDTNAGWKEMFLHPKQAGGIVVQLAQSVPELDENLWEHKWPFPEPAVGGPARGPVELLALVIAARSEQRARRQWGQLLGGHERRGGKGLVYGWPGSPMLVRVECSPACTPGPVAVEVAGMEEAAARAASRVLGIEIRVDAGGRLC